MSPISTSYYIGRQVDHVSQGDEPWDWAIVMGDATIRNKDESVVEAPEDLEGLTLMRTIFSELDTRLQFGKAGSDVIDQEVVLSPTKYTMQDPTYAPTELYIQVPEEFQGMDHLNLPEDPSEERVVDQPLGGEIMGDETEQTAEEVAQEAAAEGTESQEGAEVAEESEEAAEASEGEEAAEEEAAEA